MFPKPKTYRSRGYLEFTRRLPCSIGRLCNGDTQAHHTEKAGVGLKGDDLSCIPLCSYHHQEIHLIGAKSFEAKHLIDLARENVLTIRAYTTYLEKSDK